MIPAAGETNSLIEAKTERLILRQWRDTDLPIFEQVNANPEVMESFPSVLTKEQSRVLAQRIRDKISQNGWGFWAVERISDNKFLGFVGLNEPDYEMPVSPCIEVGWRLGRDYWGCGYASEAAKKCLEIGFDTLKFSEIYSFTAVPNNRSKAVMERIGMHNTFNNFEHPMLPAGHPLRVHVLYKIDRESWALGI